MHFTSDVEDIEILFIDGANQDFKYWSTYWVPVFLSRLHGHFEAVHNVLAGSTVAFRLLSPLPPTALEDLEDHVKE